MLGEEVGGLLCPPQPAATHGTESKWATAGLRPGRERLQACGGRFFSPSRRHLPATSSPRAGRWVRVPWAGSCAAGGEGDARLGETASQQRGIEEMKYRFCPNSVPKGRTEIAVRSRQLGPSWCSRDDFPNLPGDGNLPAASGSLRPHASPAGLLNINRRKQEGCALPEVALLTPGRPYSPHSHCAPPQPSCSRCTLSRRHLPTFVSRDNWCYRQRGFTAVELE